MSARPLFEGKTKKLVLAFDVGTTFSGISYVILEPGLSPEIKSVTRYPNQTHIGGAAKIPTVIYYDKEGQMQAIGAETTLESIQDRAALEEWHKAAWFKLHFRPSGDQEHSLAHTDIPALPPNKTAVQVLSDFLRYLHACSKEYLIEATPNGQLFWDSVKDTIQFVLTHPNGWTGPQQRLIRTAAVLAGLISDSLEDQSRVDFVTEGEASLHYCLQHGLSTYVEKAGENAGVLVVDAGGGTVDISAYGTVEGSNMKKFEEMHAPQCHFVGSVLVTTQAASYITSKLKGSRFEDDIPQIVETFDQRTKLHFREPGNTSFIKFGRMSVNDSELDIVRGQLRIPGSTVAEFFDPSIRSIIQAVSTHLELPKRVTAIFLVGGFAASDYMFARLNESLRPFDITFCRPDSHTNKAVSEGAISYFIDHAVSSRVSRATYGIRSTITYDPTNPQHVARKKSLRTTSSGLRKIPGYFGIMLRKGTVVSETQEYRHPFKQEISTRHLSDFQAGNLKILAYHGDEPEPTWIDLEESSYPVACIVEFGGLKDYARSLEAHAGVDSLFYRLEYDVILSFGTTELKAFVSWKENGEEKRSPATIIYE